jgi:hypothetical protein
MNALTVEEVRCRAMFASNSVFNFLSIIPGPSPTGTKRDEIKTNSVEVRATFENPWGILRESRPLWILWYPSGIPKQQAKKRESVT